MFSKPVKAMISAARLLFKSRRTLALMSIVYGCLLAATYLFISTREATVFQLLVTLVLVLLAPALFFVLQALSVSYPTTAAASGPIRKLAGDCLKLVVVSMPVIAVTVLTLYGLSKVQSHLTIATTLCYLLIAVVAPLLTIQLWIATTTNGLRSLTRSLRRIIAETFSPQSMLVYACGFLVFAVGPYLLVMKNASTHQAWLELSLLILRLAASAILILLGWVTTVGALSIISRQHYLKTQ